MLNVSTRDNSLIQATVRIRKDQRKRLELEINAKGVGLADAIRDNLDLAFAIKEELSKIVEGEYDENDPKNAPRLVHSLLFRVEERILAALDNLAERISHSKPVQTNPLVKDPAYLIENLVGLLSAHSDYSIEVWLGAFLEIAPRMEMIGDQQMQELEDKGKLWLEENSLFNKKNSPSGYLSQNTSDKIAQE